MFHSLRVYFVDGLGAHLSGGRFFFALFSECVLQHTLSFDLMVLIYVICCSRNLNLNEIVCIQM